jgi:hypothetical protein
VHSPEEALAEVERFYRVFHSSRSVGDRLLLRLRRPLSDEELRGLSVRFADIIPEDGLATCALPLEDRADPQLAVLHGISFRFGKRQFSRLRQLMDAINAL